MYARHDHGAAILSAAHRARVLAVQLFSTPRNATLIGPFFETAMTIDEVGQKLGMVELSDLSARLMSAAKREISSEADVTQLDSVLARLAVIADALGQRESEQPKRQLPKRAVARSNSRLTGIGRRWPMRP
jgi:hypothetical protein